MILREYQSYEANLTISLLVMKNHIIYLSNPSFGEELVEDIPSMEMRSR
jgi:hypothetical protein